MLNNAPSDGDISPFRFRGHRNKTVVPRGNLSEQAKKEKEARVVEWKARKKAKKEAAKSRGTPKILPHDDSMEETEVKTITKSMANMMIAFLEWGEISNVIKGYQEGLKTIQERLKSEGKRCTGCALNPYRAKAIESLLLDFSNPKVMDDQEIALIKSALKTNSLQVGTKGGQAHLR